MNKENLVLRQIKSFVLRQGKITLGQQKALEELMPKYGISYTNNLIDLNVEFDRSAPKVVEIGFGMGQATWQIARDNPEIDYLAIEVHSPGVGSLLIQANENQITNLKIVHHDAVEILKNMIADNSISGFHIFFPDPWHKSRHHKRRLIQTDFIKLLCDKLKIGGYLHLATDWENYAQWMLGILKQAPLFYNTSTTNDYISRPKLRPRTKFENRGIKLGHGVWDLIFTKK